MAKGNSYMSSKSGKSVRAPSEMSRGRQSIDNALGTFRLHLRTSTVLDDEVVDAFDPNSLAVKIWDQILFFGYLCEIFTLPLMQAFGFAIVAEAWIAIVLCGCAEVLFFFDLFIKARTGFYSDGNLVRDRRKTRLRYMQSPGFVLDLIALSPFSYLTFMSATLRAKLELVKLVRSIRMVRFVASLDEFYTAHFVIMKLAKVIVGTVLLSHVIACMRVCFGYNEDGTNEWLPEAPEEGHFPTTRERYLQALFWGFGVLTGLFEGELPHSIAQFLFTNAVAISGFFTFVTLCATIFVISKSESGNTEAVEARINQLVHLLSYHRVPECVQAPAIEYLRRHYTDVESNDRETIKLLCPSIATDIQVELLKSTVASISVFQGCSEQFIIALTSMLKPMAVPAQTTVFATGDAGDSMYIVNSGVLNVIINSVKVRELRKGACFGELSVFSDMKRTATVASATYAILYRLSRFHCERVLDGYPLCAILVSSHVQKMLSGMAQVNTASLTSSSRSMTSKISSLGLSIKKNFSTVASGRKSMVVPTSNVDETSDSGTSLSNGRAVPGQDQDLGTAVSSRSSVTGDENVYRDMASHIKLQHLIKFYDQAHSKQPGACNTEEVVRPSIWTRILPKQCIDADSNFRKWWLILLMINLLYYWMVVPMQLVFPLWRWPSAYFITLDVLMDAGLFVDMMLNFSLSFTVDAEKIMDPRRSARRYLRRGFALDFLCLFPYTVFTAASDAYYGLTRVPRLARIFRLPHHLNRIEHLIQLNSKRRLMLFGILMCMMYHVIACLHFGTTYIEGFSHDEEAWIPCHDIYLRAINRSYFEGPHEIILRLGDSELRAIAAKQYFRSLYYATNVLAALGKTIEPASEAQYAMALIFMLNGFLITAIVVDNVQKRFTASAFEQKEFFATRTRIQLFLRRQNAPSALHYRVNSFLDFWWSAHRGAVTEELLADLPPAIKLDVLRSICRPVLQTITLLANVRPVLDKLEEFLVEHAQFVLYGQGETVYWKGDYVTGMFFVLEGELNIAIPDEHGVEVNGSSRTVPSGGFFGTAALMNEEHRGNGYAEHVTTIVGCIVLFFSKEQLSAMKKIFPHLFEELLVLQKRLLSNKLVGRNHRGSVQPTTLRQATSKRLKTLVAKVTTRTAEESTGPIVFDPDSVFVLAWETWLFFIMSVQWITVIYQISFRTVKSTYVMGDAITAILEVFFLIDLWIRMRLGYYEFGSKVLEARRIRRNFLRSTTFAVDAAALLPLFIGNWALSSEQRLDLLNINKLLRLFKVPRQLETLENRYLKLTIELRLFKLLYYAFMLTHIFGCIWFDFGSSSSDPHGEPEFGGDEWVPPAYLQFATASRQYFQSLFWSFGLMSASSTGELPKTVSQCAFSVITMTSGFFLFAYVVGNFTDIIELMDAENREFNEKLGSVRQLLAHFNLPTALQERLKTFYMFRRFHSITREHILARCLPPSLLTDIRLVHLKPMIDKVEFLSGMDSSVTRMLVSQFSQLLVTRDEFVCQFGDDASDMFFVFVGVLEVLIPDDGAEESCEIFKGDKRTLPEDERAAGFTSAQPVSSARKRALYDAKRQHDTKQPRLKKLNEISGGGYFGENGLFTRSKRNAYIQARTSCILYKLSRESLELVFDRYPEWKQRVMRITTIREEQARLARLAAAEVACRPTYSAHITKVAAPSPLTSDSSSRRAAILAKMLIEVALRVQKGVRKLLVHVLEGADAQSSFHLWWLRITVVSTVYIAIIVPYRITMDSLDRSSPIPTIAKGFEVFCEVFFLADIWFSWHVRRCSASMELYELPHRAQYIKERLLWDAISAMPLDRFLVEFTTSPWLRLLRCAKTLNIGRYLEELNRSSVAYEINYAVRVILLYYLAIYWASCAYLAIAMDEGFAEEWDGWRPSTSLIITDPDNPSSHQLAVRFLRALFYATTAFVKKGRTFTADSTPLLAFSIMVAFTGLLVMSFVLGELANLFLSYIGLEVNFRKNNMAVQQYLTRVKVSEPLRVRARKFMISFWSSHAGVNYKEVLDEMPLAIRSSCFFHVAHVTVEWFVIRVFQPACCWSGSPLALDPTMAPLTRDLIEHLQFEGYPGGESVLVEGSISTAMHFVLRGHLEIQSQSVPALAKPVGLRQGDFFGERGLLGGAVSHFSVRTVRACDLLSLRPEALLKVLQSHEATRLALDIVHRAYEHIQIDVATATGSTRQDMEKHWGATLQRVIREMRVEMDREPGVSFQLKSHLQDMSLALETPAECLQAFSAVVQLTMSVDPYNWHAAVGRFADEEASVFSPISEIVGPPSPLMSPSVIPKARHTTGSKGGSYGSLPTIEAPQEDEDEAEDDDDDDAPPEIELEASWRLSARGEEGFQARTEETLGDDATVGSCNSRRSSSAAVIVSTASTSFAVAEMSDARARTGSLRDPRLASSVTSDSFSIGILVEETDLSPAIEHNNFRRLELQTHALQFGPEGAGKPPRLLLRSHSARMIPNSPRDLAARSPVDNRKAPSSLRPTRLPPLPVAPITDQDEVAKDATET